MNLNIFLYQILHYYFNNTLEISLDVRHASRLCTGTYRTQHPRLRQRRAARAVTPAALWAIKQKVSFTATFKLF